MDVQSCLRAQQEEASPDLVRAMVQEFAQALMGAEADALCGAAYGERSPERVNIRNGYRERAWDTRVGTIELPIPTLRQGSQLCRLAARTASAGRAGVRVRDRRCVPGRRLHPPRRQARPPARGRGDVEEPGLAAGEEPGGDRRGRPAARGRALPVPRARRARDPLPRRRPHRLGLRRARRRRQPRRLPLLARARRSSRRRTGPPGLPSCARSLRAASPA